MGTSRYSIDQKRRGWGRVGEGWGGFGFLTLKKTLMLPREKHVKQPSNGHCWRYSRMSQLSSCLASVSALHYPKHPGRINNTAA